MTKQGPQRESDDRRLISDATNVAKIIRPMLLHVARKLELPNGIFGLGFYGDSFSKHLYFAEPVAETSKLDNPDQHLREIEDQRESHVRLTTFFLSHVFLTDQATVRSIDKRTAYSPDSGIREALLKVIGESDNVLGNNICLFAYPLKPRASTLYLIPQDQRPPNDPPALLSKAPFLSVALRYILVEACFTYQTPLTFMQFLLDCLPTDVPQRVEQELASRRGTIWAIANEKTKVRIEIDTKTVSGVERIVVNGAWTEGEELHELFRVVAAVRSQAGNGNTYQNPWAKEEGDGSLRQFYKIPPSPDTLIDVYDYYKLRRLFFLLFRAAQEKGKTAIAIAPHVLGALVRLDGSRKKGGSGGVTRSVTSDEDGAADDRTAGVLESKSHAKSEMTEMRNKVGGAGELLAKLLQYRGPCKLIRFREETAKGYGDRSEKTTQFKINMTVSFANRLRADENRKGYFTFVDQCADAFPEEPGAGNVK